MNTRDVAVPVTDATVQPGELARARAWCAHLLSGTAPAGRFAAGAPFSFRCGERSSRDWLALETAERESSEWRDGARTHALRWHDADTGLTCTLELTEYADFPAVEWVVRLRNDGAADTPPLHDFAALDTAWSAASDDVLPVLERALGSDGRADDFQLLREELRESMWSMPPRHVIRMDSAANAAFRTVRNGSPSWLREDGRTSATWLPFFNLCTDDDGVLVLLGWSGEWFAEFNHGGHGVTRVSAGMEHLHLALRPGESLRSPRVLLLPWQGTPRHAHNLLRQFLLAWHCPQDADGRPLPTPICCGAWGGTPTAGHLERIAHIAAQRLPYDYYWVDAGWYGTADVPSPDVFAGAWGRQIGDWRVNLHYHPDGLKPISEAAHRAGMGFLLWFEPETAIQGTPMTLAHPEWFLTRHDGPRTEGEQLLLNLGHPDAWRYIVETVSGLIAENGIDCYREDFNIDPVPFWRLADTSGRTGETELRFVEGLYAFWDELRRRHPGLLIDNCASGGRRLDLETISRSLALWRTDYNCFPALNPDAVQIHTAGLAQWLPDNATSPGATPGDTYQVRSAFSAGLVLSMDEFGLRRDFADPSYPWAWHRRMLEEADRLRPFFYGDVYPLTPCSTAPEAWSVLQLHRPDLDAGALLAFRRPESPVCAATYQLQGLRTDRTYVFTDVERGAVTRLTGRELRTAGLPLTLAEPRSSCLLLYQADTKES